MNAVDRFNKSVNSISLRRSSLRWDCKLSMFLIETIIHNSYILLGKKKNRDSKTDYIEDLLNCYLPSEQIYEQTHFLLYN